MNFLHAVPSVWASALMSLSFHDLNSDLSDPRLFKLLTHSLSESGFEPNWLRWETDSQISSLSSTEPTEPISFSEISTDASMAWNARRIIFLASAVFLAVTKNDLTLAIAAA